MTGRTWQLCLAGALLCLSPGGALAQDAGPAADVVGRFNSIWRRDADGQWYVVFDKGS